MSKYGVLSMAECYKKNKHKIIELQNLEREMKKLGEVEGIDNGEWLNYTMSDRLKIRKAYRLALPLIKKKQLVNPYSIWPHSWVDYMSPIEKNIWNDIRYMGLPFYPQFPVGNRFADFADPRLGIIIEADSWEFHDDPGKELIRDKYLKEKGYSLIIHVRGKHTFSSPIDWEDYETQIQIESLRSQGYEEDEIRDIIIEDLAPDYYQYSEQIIRKLRFDFYR